MDYDAPKIALDGRVFMFDPEAKKLIQWANRMNTIDLSDLRGGKDYRFIYDKEKRNAVAGPNSRPASGKQMRISIPAEFFTWEKMPPDEVIRPLNELSLKKNQGFLLVNQALNRRINGHLPKIDIDGSLFFIDWRLREFRAVDDFMVRLETRDFSLSDDGNNYLFAYHTPTRSLRDIFSDITELPKDVVLVEVPNELALDPVAVARECGMSEAGLQHRYPVASSLSARIIPLSETAVADLVAENRAKSGLQSGSGHDWEQKDHFRPSR